MQRVRTAEQEVERLAEAEQRWLDASEACEQVNAVIALAKQDC